MTGNWFVVLVLLLVITMLSRHPETGALEGSRILRNLVALAGLAILWVIILKPFLGL